MAFPGTVGDRKMDDLGFRSPQSHEAAAFPPYAPLRLGDSTPLAVSNDARATIQRRFTTDSMKISFSPRASYEVPGLQRMPIAETLDLAPSTLQKFQAITKENEKLQESKRRMQVELERMELQERQNELEIRRITQELSNPLPKSTGHSEPTTPPEFKDIAFSDRRVRTGFMPSSLLATPPSIARHEAAAHQLMTPPAEDILPIFGQKAPSKSVPNSRRNSDENEFGTQPEEPSLGQRLVNTRYQDLQFGEVDKKQTDTGGYRLANNNVPRTAVQSTETGSSMLNLLLDEEAERNGTTKTIQTAASPGVKSYLQMNSTDDKFPILVRRDSYPNILSASSAALDLAVQKKGPESQQATWSTSFARHRPAQHSLPVNNYPYTPTSNSSPKVTVPQTDSPVTTRRYERGPNDLPLGAFAESHKLISGEAPSILHQSMMPKLQSSFSTPDIPTLRHNSGNVMRGTTFERHRRELSSGLETATGTNNLTFGPPLSGAMAPMQQVITPPGITPLPSPGLYGPYVGVTNPIFHAAPFGAYPVVPVPKVTETVQARPIQKRNHDGETNRYAATNLVDHVNEIYSLCKDQHGCRYLQKKLEEKNPQHVQMIFQETHLHVVELMTDPFGNYLCQKLLEYATDEQRTVLVNNAAPQLVKIALNQHGTRALQKMIEYLSTPAQIQTIVNALKTKVVELIQDLNGNHVIQKCLNRLTSEDSQFIFDAVGEHCVPVGTHRHGCCVLQRCIDHASGPQKVQLISQITEHAFQLVQDPFGNYVVQYILDQEETKLSEQLINRFLGSVCQLSKQKFSSNCIRVAEPATKKRFIEEMMNPLELDKLIRDSYANYVIQTALDYADASTRQQLVESIRPILPAIRMTPYGRRIQSKIQLSSNQNTSTYNNNVLKGVLLLYNNTQFPHFDLQIWDRHSHFLEQLVLL
ncbi:armadillo-type protein [Kalaharituber pfeilii]|nr:armadillo-type protein [Kalaharituber pfeilii]